ncbi:MAG: dihydrodipicolinate synthase family protein, partial [Clostridia bacterium]|nr:dihydrodipicolinate synthase family protein [Clostridia bacterium]
MNPVFHGVFPALLTPFDASGAVNYNALRELVQWNLGKGVNGFYVCGSTSEAFLLTGDERKKIVETVCAEAAGKAAVIAHVGCIGQDMAVDLARHAKEAGADAISSVPPFYYGFSFEEIKSYYFALADVGLPVFIYNFTAAGGARLTAAQFMEFLSDPRFLGVKHTSSDFFLLERLKAFRPDAVIFNGYDEMFLSGLAAGADGGIGSTYNFMAEKYIAI